MERKWFLVQKNATENGHSSLVTIISTGKKYPQQEENSSTLYFPKAC